MVEKKNAHLSRYDFKYHIEQVSGKNFKDMSAEDLVKVLFDEDGRSSEFIVKSYYDYSERTFINRLNILWVWPTMLIIAPFQYLITGNIGVNRNTKIGRIVERLVKFD